MKKITLLLIVYLATFLFCLAKPNNGTSESQVNGILLKYNFGKRFPISFIISKSGHYYVNDGYGLFVFSNTGELSKKIILPLKITGDILFQEFLISDDEQTVYINHDNHILAYDIKANKISSEINSYGTGLQMDSTGTFYMHYQDHDIKTNQIVNRIRVISRLGKGIDYPTKTDVAAESFLVAHSKIFFYTSDNHLIHCLPVISLAGKLKAVHKKINLPYGLPVVMLGSINKDYYFRHSDYDSHSDTISRFNGNFQLVKRSIVKLDYNQLNQEYRNSDFLTDWPSGNIYSYDGGNGIYFIRNTKKGTYVFNLKDFFK